MSAEADSGRAPLLVGSEGKLLSVRVAVPWRELEDVLDTLATAEFPINPEIRHGSPLTFIEFPAYSGQVGEIERLLCRSAAHIEPREVWAELTGA